ncbi:helix-turn-helix domain-containing protein [Halomarina oriensis]|uniref:Helix-turn-helix domain-containing protein n=1 Tax=Halomarina oriensis TaxID=671145 RepID=A0A6B0GRL7_9EURY|nr:helix-turn-helix domain-containing protein [Halomarina oriensis]MWG36289.1 helix-turn-helix domain-containing protein [Halomarina oriensis]
MFQAEIHLQQEKYCVLHGLADRFDATFDIAIEEHHDHLVTFVLELDDARPEHVAFLETADQVERVEELESGRFLVTKRSCGAYAAVEQNHGILRRRNHITPTHRVYTVLLFRREDLRAMIDEFRQVGAVTLGKITRFDEPSHQLTGRQREVVSVALELGYFEWPRRINSEQLAAELDISRATLLEHLRKAESKLITAALDDTEPRTDRTGFTDPAGTS